MNPEPIRKLNLDRELLAQYDENSLVRWLCQRTGISSSAVRKVSWERYGSRYFTLDAFCDVSDFPLRLKLSRLSNLHSNSKAQLSALLLRFELSPLYEALTEEEQKNPNQPIGLVVKRLGIPRGLLVYRGQPIEAGSTLTWSCDTSKGQESIHVTALITYVQNWLQHRRETNA